MCVFVAENWGVVDGGVGFKKSADVWHFVYVENTIQCENY